MQHGSPRFTEAQPIEYHSENAACTPEAKTTCYCGTIQLSQKNATQRKGLAEYIVTLKHLMIYSDFSMFLNDTLHD